MACSWQAYPGPAVSEVYSATTHDLRVRTLLLEKHCGGELKSWGSAVLLESQLAVTAAHVVDIDPSEGACGIMATDSWGNVSRAYAIWTDLDSDLARVSVDQLPDIPLTTRTRAPQWGERIACVGYSFAPLKRRTQMMSITHGTVATTPDEGMPGGRYRITAPVLPGHSGGGCWGVDGALLLIVQEGHFQYEGHIYGRRVP